MDKKKKSNRQDSPTEGKTLRDRKFNLTEALGRENVDLLKGASPVAKGRQVLLEIKQFLDNGLADSNGSLLRTIMARMEDNPPLLSQHFDNPLGALAETIENILNNDRLLVDLVRDTDARWGREYQERPRFELDDTPALPDDPYTIAGVRAQLTDLQTELYTED
ncbi:MAG: hypothetical protein KOO60_00435 [Gemmatimonadales bacterium]|nr:hypothetical protein [Gemmatimonadales bacterium]